MNFDNFYATYALQKYYDIFGSWNNFHLNLYMKYEMSIAYAYFICFIIKCSKNWFGNQCILLYLKGLFGAWLLTKLGRTWTCQLTHSDSFVLHSGSMGHGNSGITKKNPVSGFFSFFHVFLIALLRSNCSNLDTTATTNLALSIKSEW